MKCPICGSENRDGCVFCAGCGSPLNANGGGNSGADTATVKKSGQKNQKALIIALAAVAVIAVVVAVIFATKTFSKQKETKNEYVISEFISEDAIELKNVKIGDEIEFGVYEQDNNADNGKETLRWIVLDKNENELLLITEKCIDCRPYNDVRTDVTWENCSLRAWLNSSFIDSTFNDSEKSVIVTSKNTNNNNSQYGTYGGGVTQDKVFILSVSEVENYFPSQASRRAETTPYAKANGAYVSEIYGTSWWWLRTPGSDSTKAALVYIDGNIKKEGGTGVHMNNDAVRPVIRIRYKISENGVSLNEATTAYAATISTTAAPQTTLPVPPTTIINNQYQIVIVEPPVKNSDTELMKRLLNMSQDDLSNEIFRPALQASNMFCLAWDGGVRSTNEIEKYFSKSAVNDLIQIQACLDTWADSDFKASSLTDYGFEECYSVWYLEEGLDNPQPRVINYSYDEKWILFEFYSDLGIEDTGRIDYYKLVINNGDWRIDNVRQIIPSKTTEYRGVY